MLKSMTGYGSVSKQGQGLDIFVEVKTLNSKFLDLVSRIPRELSELETRIRNDISDKLQRGKVMLTIEISHTADAEPKQRYNTELFSKYYMALDALATGVDADKSEIFRLALESPDVIISQPEQGFDGEKARLFFQALDEALDICDHYRIQEGERLSVELVKYVESIRENLKAVEKLDPLRTERIGDRLRENVAKIVDDEHVDENRLEQELIYYVEKLDITEEKVRLFSHLDFFNETLQQTVSTGKKLGFIAQEMGREINTIGSKANDAEVQKHVVQMKEELEKIKEQILNIV